MSEAAFLSPESVIPYFHIQPGMRVADFGSGGGEFALLIAREVGKEGIVSAIDVRQEPLSTLKGKAKAEHLTNIELIRANLEVLGNTKLREDSQDRVLIINNLFQSNQKAEIIHEAWRVTKVGGKLVVVDWKKSVRGAGPPDEYRTEERIIKDMVRERGFHFEHEFDAGKFHFGMIFNKPGE